MEGKREKRMEEREKVWAESLVENRNRVELETSVSDRSPALFIMFHILALFLANAARRSTLINEFIGNSRDVGLGPRQPEGTQSGKRLETIRSVTPRHFNFPKKLSNYELF